VLRGSAQAPGTIAEPLAVMRVALGGQELATTSGTVKPRAAASVCADVASRSRLPERKSSVARLRARCINLIVATQRNMKIFAGDVSTRLALTLT
jgi:hypothetical protein